MSLPSPLITLDRVSLRAGSNYLLKDCSWRLERGQQWVLLGRRGSGKSAFGRVVAGLLPVSSGEISYSVDPRERYPTAETYVAYAAFDAALSTDDYFVQARYWSQDTSPLVDDYLSEENVFEINPYEVRPPSGRSRRYRRDKEHVVRLLAIEGLREKEIHQLSNGEARKVKLAHTLLLDRPILILDDPFGGIDAAYKERLGAIIRRLVRSGKQCMLIVEHACDVPGGMSHFALFDHARLTRSGPISALPPAARRARQTGSRVRSVPPPMVRLTAPHRSAVPVAMRNATVLYGTVPAVSGVSWTVARGERWLVTGPNGAGKTTLLSLLLGDHPQAYANDVRIFGKQWGENTVRLAVRKRIGWASPELLCGFPLDGSCLEVVCSGFYDTIGLFARCGGVRTRHARAWMRTLEIERFADLPLHALPRGVRRLSLIARALVKDPELLVLDEPFLGLDNAAARRTAEVIDRYCAASGAALIVVTHEPEPVQFRNMKRLRMKNGRALCGPAQDGERPSSSPSKYPRSSSKSTSA